MDAGLPDGAIRPKPVGPLAPDPLRDALSETEAELDLLDARRLDPLLAWLKAWKHHWPARFQEVLGTTGDRCLARLSMMPIDPNRYLKLRRIAIENLSGLL